MRVTVCQLTDERRRFEEDWRALCPHARAARSTLVLLPELLRVQAKALLAASSANEARAVRLLLRSCRIARRQSAQPRHPRYNVAPPSIATSAPVM